MTDSIDNNFYCSRGGQMCDKCSLDDCHSYKRKHPTPEQFKEEYGVEYPDDAAVYYFCCVLNKWEANLYSSAKCFKGVTHIVCACTPWSCPPNNYKPEV